VKRFRIIIRNLGRPLLHLFFAVGVISLTLSVSTPSILLGQKFSSLPKLHKQALEGACRDLHRGNLAKQVKCRKRLLNHHVKKYGNKFLDLEDLKHSGRVTKGRIDSILTNCIGLIKFGDPEKRLKKFDDCLREYLDNVPPGVIPLPPKLANKPIILIVEPTFLEPTCSQLPKYTTFILNSDLRKLGNYLKEHVAEIKTLQNSFISQFWCTDKNLFFKEVLKLKGLITERPLYALSINFVQNNKSRLEYQLYDVKSKGFVFRGHISSQSIGSGITAKELKNMRNQILKKILLHGSE